MNVFMIYVIVSHNFQLFKNFKTGNKNRHEYFKIDFSFANASRDA